MSTFEQHCRESAKLFGKSYDEVHEWLDEFKGTEKYGMRHRKVRHHQEGIKRVVELLVKKPARWPDSTSSAI